MTNQRSHTYPDFSDNGKLQIQRQAAEKQRQQAEIQCTLVAQQYLDLVVNWAAAEQQRLIDEEVRFSAEAERQESEKQRCVGEQSRISAEKSRQAAEEARQAAEKLRQATEEARVAAEMLRQAAEQARQATYEQQVVLNEMRHAAQEFDRINLEWRPSNR